MNEFNFPPKLDCVFCKGTGKIFVDKLKKERICICRFVDHSVSNDIGREVGKAAKRINSEAKK